MSARFPAVDRIHPARLSDQVLEAAVVIDVLRATSTAIVLLERGAPAVRVISTPADLAGLPPADRPYLVFSELAASRDCGLDCVDNSPAAAAELDLAGRSPVLVTTNGTRAIAAAIQRASRVLIAGFVNLSSTVRTLRGAGRVTLLPAGDFDAGEPRTEDERCADALEGMLLGASPDLAALIAACRADPRVQRRVARHPELVHDIDLALTVDRCSIAAAARTGADGGLFLVPAGGRI